MFSLTYSKRSSTAFGVDHETFRPPSAALRRFVRQASTTLMPSATMRDFVFERLPEPSVHVYFLAATTSLDAPLERATIRVEGGRDRLETVAQAGATVGMLGVELEIGAARQVLGVPAGSLFGQALSLEDLWGRRAGELVDQMLSAPTAQARARVLTQTLLSRARATDPPPKSIRGALRAIERTRGQVRIADLAKKVGMSARQLQRQFTDEIGCAPKRYARIARLRRLLFAHDERAPFTWADHAAALGYADQAHLIADFRTMMGAPPERLLGQGDFVHEYLRDGWFLTPRVSDFYKTERAPLP